MSNNPIKQEELKKEALENEKWLKNLEEAYKENADAELEMAEALAPVSAEADKIILNDEDLS